MLEVIIDGANVASINGTGRRDPKRIETAIGQLDPKADCVIAVLPSYWSQRKAYVENPEALQSLIQEDKLQLIDRDDDYYMIKYCVENNAFLLTNDKLRDHRQKEGWTTKHEEWARTHLLDYEIVNGKLLLSKNSEKLLNNAEIENLATGSELVIEIR